METNLTTSREKALLVGSYNLRLLKDLESGDIFQTQPGGPLYVVGHYVPTSGRICYYRYSGSRRYYYGDVDMLVFVD